MARRSNHAEEEDDNEGIEIPAPDDEMPVCPECEGEGCEACDYEGVAKVPSIKELDEFQ